MMFLYFIAEVVMAYFALTKYDISEEVKQCNCEDDFERIHSYVHKRRKITLVFIVILLLMSSFQAIDWLRMCSSRAGFQTILNQDVDSTFQGFLFFANVVVAVTSIVYIIKIVNELSKNGLDALLRERITEVDSFNIALSNLEKKYGRKSDLLRTSSDDTVLTNAIIRFDSSQHLFCLGQIIPYNEIKRCDGYSIPIYKTTTKTVTKTSTGSALGRAVVGGAIAGPVGAIIGGTTGKKNSETVTKNEIERMEYKVVITLKDDQTITIPLDPLLFIYHYGKKDKTIQTAEDVVKRFETFVNGAVNVYKGLSVGQSEMTKLPDTEEDMGLYVCTMCGYTLKISSHPSDCPMCGNKTFNIKQ